MEQFIKLQGKEKLLMIILKFLTANNFLLAPRFYNCFWDFINFSRLNSKFDSINIGSKIDIQVRLANKGALQAPDVSAKTCCLIFFLRITLLSPCIWNISSPFPLSKCQLIWHNLNFHQNEMFVIWSDGIFEHTSALQNGIQNVSFEFSNF